MVGVLRDQKSEGGRGKQRAANAQHGKALYGDLVEDEHKHIHGESDDGRVRYEDKRTVKIWPKT
jgi:hypothetical protein